MSYFQVGSGDTVGSAHMNTAINQGVIPFADAATRDAAIPAPTSGMKCWLEDLNQEQTYFTVAGALGWRPTGGILPWGRLEWTTAIPVGIGEWPIGVPSQTALFQGGMRTVNADNTGLVTPHPGIYLISVKGKFSLLAAGETVEIKFGDWATAHVVGTNAYPTAGGIMNALAVAHFRYDAGVEVFARYYSGVNAQLDNISLMVTYLSAAA